MNSPFSNSMLNIPALAAVLCCVMLGTFGPLFASHITLQINVSPAVRENQLSCLVNITNQGDESASSVQVHLEFQGRRYSSAALPTLAVGQNHSASFSLPTAGLPGGRHALAIFVDYADLNGYPFTALSHGDFIIGDDNPPSIHGVIDPIDLGSEETLVLRIKNLDGTPKEIKMKLFLPKEISSPQPENQISLNGSTEQSVRFRIRNFSALEGSTYQVFVLAEYDEQGKHSCFFTPGTVKIVPARSFFSRNKWALGVAAGLLILLLIGIQIVAYRKGGGSVISQ